MEAYEPGEILINTDTGQVGTYNFYVPDLSDRVMFFDNTNGNFYNRPITHDGCWKRAVVHEA